MLGPSVFVKKPRLLVKGDPLFERAKEMYKLGKYDQAISLLTTIIKRLENTDEKNKMSECLDLRIACHLRLIYFDDTESIDKNQSAILINSMKNDINILRNQMKDVRGYLRAAQVAESIERDPQRALMCLEDALQKLEKLKGMTSLSMVRIIEAQLIRLKSNTKSQANVKVQSLLKILRLPGDVKRKKFTSKYSSTQGIISVIGAIIEKPCINVQGSGQIHTLVLEKCLFCKDQNTVANNTQSMRQVYVTGPPKSIIVKHCQGHVRLLVDPGKIRHITCIGSQSIEIKFNRAPRQSGSLLSNPFQPITCHLDRLDALCLPQQTQSGYVSLYLAGLCLEGATIRANDSVHKRLCQLLLAHPPLRTLSLRNCIVEVSLPLQHLVHLELVTCYLLAPLVISPLLLSLHLIDMDLQRGSGITTSLITHPLNSLNLIEQLMGNRRRLTIIGCAMDGRFRATLYNHINQEFKHLLVQFADLGPEEQSSVSSFINDNCNASEHRSVYVYRSREELLRPIREHYWPTYKS